MTARPPLARTYPHALASPRLARRFMQALRTKTADPDAHEFWTALVKSLVADLLHPLTPGGASPAATCVRTLVFMHASWRCSG